MLHPHLRQFLAYYRPYTATLLADMVCALAVAGIALLLPLGVRVITGSILPHNPPDAPAQIMALSLLLLALLLLQTGCTMFVDYRGHMMGAKMERDMRRDLFEHYQTLSFSFYDDRQVGQLMTHLTGDLLAITELAHHGPEDAIIGLLKFCGAFLILFLIHPLLALLLLLMMPPLALFAIYFNRRMNHANRLSRERIGDINARVEDALAGIRVVQSFANEGLERAKFDCENERFLASRRLGYWHEMWFSGGMLLLTQLLTLLVVAVGGVALAQGTLTLSDLLTFLLVVGILVDPIQKAVNLVRLYQEGITGFARFAEMLAVVPEIVDAPGATDLPPVRGEIELRGVSFKYREEQQNVLSNLSLHIRPGDYVALVGLSGAGKSTLCALIPRFYEATAGAIYVDGHDIRQVRLASLRSQIGMVQQDVYLFAGTVAENIAYGRPGASRDAIIAAAQQAHAHSFIMGLPQGYDTDIGQRGVKLSGGQKQRLSIARVFLKNPPILLLDEATSALDNDSERAVQESLEALTHRRTVLVIAHRLSTVRHAGRIIVLTPAGIGEEGTHDELIARGGLYAGLYRRQLTV